MFIDNQQTSLDAYYYRPSMMDNEPQVVAPQAASLDGVPTPGNPSGKTWRDFLPRDWFDSSVYRNILDMLNTLEVVDRNLLRGTYGQFLTTVSRAGTSQIRVMLTGPLPDDRAFWGYAHKKTPWGDQTISRYIFKYVFGGKNYTGHDVGSLPEVQRALKNAGYRAPIRSINRLQYGAMNNPRESKKFVSDEVDRHNRRITAGNGYSSQDIINIVRSLDWEMNRVHLPLPFNLRQWAIRYQQLTMVDNGISWAERVQQLRKLYNWIRIMREKIRQAIDASNLKKKVAEQSLRKENAAIVKANAEQRKKLELQRMKEIEAERKASQTMIVQEKKRLATELLRQTQKQTARVLTEQQRAMKQAKIQPVAPIATRPEVVGPTPRLAPPPKPTPEFKAPQITRAVAPIDTVPVPKQPTNILPLIAVGAAALMLGA